MIMTLRQSPQLWRQGRQSLTSYLVLLKIFELLFILLYLVYFAPQMNVAPLKIFYPITVCFIVAVLYFVGEIKESINQYKEEITNSKI